MFALLKIKFVLFPSNMFFKDAYILNIFLYNFSRNDKDAKDR
jgi:hypothetical protein